MTDTTYGGKIQNALHAVVQMHKDTSKLLQSCDDTIGKGKKPIFRGYATDDLSRSYDAPQWSLAGWMVPGVYRYYYASTKQPGLVEGVTAVFVPYKIQPISEPLFIVGQLDYKIESDGDDAKQKLYVWDLWDGFFDKQALYTVLHPQNVGEDAKDRIKTMKLIAVPLYSIKDIEQVEALMEQVRQAS